MCITFILALCEAVQILPGGKAVRLSIEELEQTTPTSVSLMALPEELALNILVTVLKESAEWQQTKRIVWEREVCVFMARTAFLY